MEITLNPNQIIVPAKYGFSEHYNKILGKVEIDKTKKIVVTRLDCIDDFLKSLKDVISEKYQSGCSPRLGEAIANIGKFDNFMNQRERERKTHNAGIENALDRYNRLVQLIYGETPYALLTGAHSAIDATSVNKKLRVLELKTDDDVNIAREICYGGILVEEKHREKPCLLYELRQKFVGQCLDVGYTYTPEKHNGFAVVWNGVEHEGIACFDTLENCAKKWK